MPTKRPIAAAFAAFAMFAGGGVAHADPVVNNAENIRQLNIMLMVTSLRCRTGAHDFRAEYRRFTNAHLTNLNRAGEHLRMSLAATHDDRDTKRRLDRMGVSIANQYGGGHPWLGCAELKQITGDLSLTPDAERLSAAADELLGLPKVAHNQPHWPEATQ